MLATLKDILLDVYYNKVPKNDENGSKMSTKHPLNMVNQNVGCDYVDKANVITNKDNIYDKSNSNNNNDSAKVDLNMLNTNNAVSQLSDQGLFVGPYKLEKTLGKGQTGLVKLAVHCVTSKKMAIKIVNKEKLSESVLQKVEREIAIMKLIEHPHVLHLYEVYENKKYLYLVLEYVGNGELFDYLVRKGRLSPKEARKFFRQVISALDFCHAHNICHRDLKPENLLLDERYNIKVADFGMASLQVEGTMLETSCGSPHYACPEVIRGEKYDGKKADVWSAGVILYALLVGALPFDDDNLRHLLEKVKKGVFHIPHFVPPDCQGLLRAMIEVDSTKRLSLAEVFRYSWVTGNIKNDSVERELPMSLIVQTHIIPNEDNIDPDVFRHMNSLGCFKDKEKLKSELLNSRHNTEKMVYFLLLDRKRRKPTFDDETTVFSKSGSIFDPPRKRIDTTKATKYSIGSISDGSPINPRKTYGRLRYSSSNGSPYVSPMPVAKNSTFSARSSYKIAPSFNYFATSSAQTSPKPEHTSYSASRDPKWHNNNNNTYSFKDIQATVEKKLSSDLKPTQSVSANGKSSVVKSTPPTSPLSQRSSWRSRFSSLKSSILTGTPRYHRKKSGDSDVSDSEDGSVFDTTDLVKKSWFDSLASSFSSDKDEMIQLTMNKKSLNAVKAELIRAFLAVHELNHTIVDHNSFRLEFRKANVSSTTSMFIRTIRITVQIVPAVGKEDFNDRKVSKPFDVHFILISGSLRRFKRLVEHLIVSIKSFDHSPKSSDQPSDQKFSLMVRPRKLSDASVDSTTSSDVTSAVVSPGVLSPQSIDQARNQRIISTSRFEGSNESSKCTVMINRWATAREPIIGTKSSDDRTANFRTKTERYKNQSPLSPPMNRSDISDDVSVTSSNERRYYYQQQRSHKPIVEKISTPLLGRRIFPDNNSLRAKVQPFSSLS